MRRMIAFSSVAQVGYIYMGVGMGTQVGMVAAVFMSFPMWPPSLCFLFPLSV